MKSTGVIRRIDELGRIVLPKEIRRNLGIRDGENLEIFVEDDKILLQKYSKMKDFKEIIKNICDCVNIVYNHKIIVTDRDKVVYTNDDISLVDKDLDLKLIEYIQNRESILKNQMQVYTFQKIEKKGYYFIQPIISSTDCLGLILFYDEQPIQEESISLLKLMSTLISSKVDIS